MNIRKPFPHLSSDDRRLLNLLDQLLSATPQDKSHNQEPNTVLLSDKEAAELAWHFARLLETRDFLEALYFVDQIYRPNADLRALKSIFIAASRRRGRAANVHSTFKWQQFLIRLGVLQPTLLLQPMSFDHFLQMEHRLLKHLGLSAQTRETVLHMVSDSRDKHEELISNARDKPEPLTQFDFREISGERLDRSYQPEESTFKRMKERIRIFSDTVKRETSVRRLGGLLTIVSNSSVIFTSRDWGVAGVISTMCGAVPQTLFK